MLAYYIAGMMRSAINRSTGLIIGLLLVLTSQSMAAARGATDPTGKMVICTGTGPIVVYVDDSGTPVGPPQYCPDCALVLADPVGEFATVARPAEVELRLSPLAMIERCALTAEARPNARAPPVLM